ncbi:MAG TPA: hypothetical protein DIC60_02935 [Lachnospiraceae bacterium]|nr:hypothetical protein [Lachnospiraceae bacterium]
MDVAIFATLKKLLGTKTDTGGSTTDGTVNGKLNAVITNTTASTSANASGTLSQKLTYIISTLIGATGATGGTATAGTIMSKLNALLTSWTSARAGYVDTINTNTATNNTANSTGILSQKASYLISQRKVSLTGTGTTIFSYSTAFNIYLSYKCIAKFIAPISGLYVVTLNTTANASGSSTSRPLALYKTVGSIDTTATRLSVASVYDLSTVAATTYNYSTSAQLSNYLEPLFFITSTNNVAVSKTCYMFCKAGEPVVLVVCASSSDTSSQSFPFSNITITYQPTY